VHHAKATAGNMPHFVNSLKQAPAQLIDYKYDPQNETRGMAQAKKLEIVDGKN
jgi:hypothetical protein